MKIDDKANITEFAEKPKGEELKKMQARLALRVTAAARRACVGASRCT
jgi:ADP-glucose pyrophosphorylase